MEATNSVVFTAEMKERWLNQLESCRLSFDFLKKELLKLHRSMSRHLLKVGNGNDEMSEKEHNKHQSNLKQSAELCDRMLREQKMLDKLGIEGHKNGYINLDFL